MSIFVKSIFCILILASSIKVHCDPLPGPDPNIIGNDNQAISGAPYLCKDCGENLDSGGVSQQVLNLKFNLSEMKRNMGSSVLRDPEPSVNSVAVGQSRSFNDLNRQEAERFRKERKGSPLDIDLGADGKIKIRGKKIKYEKKF